MLGSPPGEPPITLSVRRTRHGQAQHSLRLSRIGIAVPDACRQLPASVSLTTQPFTLETSLQLSDGRVTETVSLPAQWTCVRNRGGAVTGLHTVEPPSPAQHRALAVSIAGPRTVTPGSIATYTVSVHNTRRGPRNPDISSLSNILVRVSLGQGASPKPTLIRGPDPVVRRLPELRPGETKLLRISMLVPDGLQQASIDRVCAAAGAIAHSTRPAGAEACSNVATLR